MPTQQKLAVYTVSQLNKTARQTLEKQFSLLWIEGEISNLAKPTSGHWYFSLKDSSAQVRCAMFRMKNQLLKCTPNNGQQVLIRARVSLYEGRGDFQLIVEHLELSGHGALLQAFEQLKTKLQQQGYFNRQKILPKFPSRIGILTSPTGAALRDILQVLQRRYPQANITLYPSAVQGQQAIPEILAMLNYIQQNPTCDVLIIARGGGSIEDLWAFNDEAVATAIFNCPLPVITGIGHEIDTTIADYIADHRAPTPSAAAELASPNQIEWQHYLQRQQQQLVQHIQHYLQQKQQQLQWLAQRLKQQHPLQRLQHQFQRLDNLELRLKQAQKHQLHQQQVILQAYHARLHQYSPQSHLQQCQQHLQQLLNRLLVAIKNKIQHDQQQLLVFMRTLHVVSPLATLDRGYAIASDQQGNILHNTNTVKVNDKIKIRLASGHLDCKITQCN